MLVGLGFVIGTAQEIIGMKGETVEVLAAKELGIRQAIPGKESD